MKRFDQRGRLVFPSLRRLHAAEKAGVVVEKDKLHLTRAFCPNGHPLITERSPKVSGRPGIELWAKGKHLEQVIALSPFRGDFSKVYRREFEAGEVLDVRCPKCKVPLPMLAPCGCTPDSSWIVMFLRQEHDYVDAIGVCNAWGCPRSYFRLSGEILTEYRLSAER